MCTKAWFVPLIKYMQLRYLLLPLVFVLFILPFLSNPSHFVFFSVRSSTALAYMCPTTSKKEEEEGFPPLPKAMPYLRHRHHRHHRKQQLDKK